MSSSYLCYCFVPRLYFYCRFFCKYCHFFITAREIAQSSFLYISFSLFLSANGYFYLVSTVAKLRKRDSSHGSNRVAVMSLLFTIFVANKHNRFHNCQPGIVVSARTNRKIYLTIAAQGRGKLATGENFLINRYKAEDIRAMRIRVYTLKQ